MADIDVEKKDGNKNGNSKMWIWLIVAIVAILVAWIAISDRNNVEEDEPELEDTALAEKILPQSHLLF